MPYQTEMTRSIVDADIGQLLRKMTASEKIELLSAPNWWNTKAIERLSIPSVRMSDGPNGVRGSSHFVQSPAQCIPCATALASTFDPEIVHRVGGFLAEEAKAKSSTILLAPTCNIQRNPLGGRAFESFSEDPHLSGIMAAAYVNGLQDNGVAATIKHFVANDQEHERLSANSVMSERALREIYLYPFMLAQKYAKPWAYMTSYGRIDNVHLSENSRIIQGILREEWDFKGLVMSDWYGTYSTSEAINAGLDLEMPGPTRWRTQMLVSHVLSAGKTTFKAIGDRASAVLSLVQHLAKTNPEVVFGDGEERTLDTPERRRFCRELAAEGIVLLKNEGGLLPLRAAQGKKYKVAVVGPNAKGTVISGGGSAALKPSYVVTPFAGLSETAPEGVEISYALGCYAHRYTPTVEKFIRTHDGQPGWTCDFYAYDEHTEERAAEPVATFVITDTRVKVNDFLPAGLGSTWGLELRAKFTPDMTGPYEFGLTVAGRARLFVDGKETIDNWTHQRKGEFFYGQGTAEELAVVDVKEGVELDIRVVYINTTKEETHEDDDDEEKAESNAALMRGLRLGGCRKIDADEAIAEAAALAKESDAVVFVGGLTSEWEAEGADRPSLALPGRQADLLRALGAANKNTVAVIQAGSAVDLTWADDVHAVVQAWYLGNEVGAALADVLYGRVNPAGRLPLSLPARIEDGPTHLNRRSENGHIHYREDLFVGYKHYHAHGTRPLFPFGFGLSYTTFELSDLEVSPVSADGALTAHVTVTNTGAVAGATVVQLYVGVPADDITHPLLQLRGFAKAKGLAPGAKTTVKIALDRLAFAYWDEPKAQWRARRGEYVLKVGQSSEDLPLVTKVKVEKTLTWNGV